MPPFLYIWEKHDQIMKVSLKYAACVLSTLSLLFLRISGLYAQQPSGWLHPELSVLAYATGIYDADAGQGRLSTRSAVSATFGRGSTTEASVSYDLIDKKMMGCEIVWHPIQALRIRAGVQRMPFLLETSYSPRTLEAVGSRRRLPISEAIPGTSAAVIPAAATPVSAWRDRSCRATGATMS